VQVFADARVMVEIAGTIAIAGLLSVDLAALSVKSNL
jgi:hypothetical protein